MKDRKWTKEIIVERLRAWKDAGVPIREMHRKDPPMTSMAAYLFGRWRLALDAAGIEPIRKKWHRERIINELRRTRGQGLPVSAVLVAASRREFGTMRLACEAAGVPCRVNVLPHKSWTRENAVEAIRHRHESGHSLRATNREDPALYAAAKRLFGNWTKAREAAGFPVQRQPSLPADEMLRQIAALASDRKALTELRESNRQVYNSAIRHFGSWLGACQAAGVPVTPLNSWTKEKLIAAIQKRHADGHELCYTWKEDTAMFGSAVHYFGNWQSALVAAGFEPARKERWTKQRVVERLRAWHERTDATNLKDSDERLSAACYRFFGSHVAAMEAAGIEPRLHDAQGKKRWTKTRVLTEMQDRFIAGCPRDQLGFGDKKLAGAAKRLFGSWLAAVESAGLTDKVNFTPVHRRWSRELVLAELRAWHGAGHRLTEIHRKNRSLFDAARSRFGTWNQAIVAAGLKPERRRYSDAEILDDIRERHRAGMSLSCKHPDNVSLSMRASNRFGTWKKALSAAGVIQFGRKKVAS